MGKVLQFTILTILLFGRSTISFALDAITVALTAKAFQYTILPVALERGYMKEEGIDLKFTYMQAGPSLQAVLAGSAQFSGAGSSALVGISKGNAPMKTVLALNDQVLQWVVARPNVASPADLKGKRVASAGVASLGTFMLRQILSTKYGVEGKEVIFIDPGPLNRLPSLMSGAADAAIVSAEERYQAVDQGMKEFMYLGKELKNSWGHHRNLRPLHQGTAQTDARLRARDHQGAALFSPRPRSRHRRHGKIH